MLFYSGAKAANGTQPYSWLSLGGYPSISPIKNSLKNSFFNDVTINEVKNKKTVYRLMVLKNTTSSTITNIKVYIEPATGCICKFEGALVEPAIDSCNNPIFENVFTEEEAPLSAVFTNMELVGNALTIPSLAAGVNIGIWMKRIINDENTDYFDADKNFKLDTCDVLFAANDDPTNFYNKKLDSFSVKIDY